MWGSGLVMTRIEYLCRATKDTLVAMCKLIGQAGEAAKVKVRQARKIAVDQSKELASEDDQKRAEKQVSLNLFACRCGNGDPTLA